MSPRGPRLPALLARNVVEIAGVTFFLVMVGSVAIGVFSRYVLNRPLIWTEEVSSFCFLWAAFLGGAAVAKRREHIAVDTLVELLPPPARRTIGVATSVLVAAMLGVVTVLGFMYAASQRDTTTEALQMPVILWALAVPVSCGLACVYAVRDLVRQARGVTVAGAVAHEAALTTPPHPDGGTR